MILLMKLLVSVLIILLWFCYFVWTGSHAYDLCHHCHGYHMYSALYYCDIIIHTCYITIWSILFLTNYNQFPSLYLFDVYVLHHASVVPLSDRFWSCKLSQRWFLGLVQMLIRCQPMNIQSHTVFNSTTKVKPNYHTSTSIRITTEVVNTFDIISDVT